MRSEGQDLLQHPELEGHEHRRRARARRRPERSVRLRLGHALLVRHERRRTPAVVDRPQDLVIAQSVLPDGVGTFLLRALRGPAAAPACPLAAAPLSAGERRGKDEQEQDQYNEPHELYSENKNPVSG